MIPTALLFDFDGVIVDSVSVKTDAFRSLFADEKEHLPRILDFHLANGGMSRFEKFKIIYRDFLNKPLSHGQAQELGNRFSQLVMRKVIECSFVPGVLEFIQKHKNKFRLFIASGTPQNELREIVAQRGLTNYFCEVLGSPRGKPEIIYDILSRYDIKPEEMPFIGDALNDFTAALSTALPFYGYVPHKGSHVFPPHTRIFHTFDELEQALLRA